MCWSRAFSAKRPAAGVPERLSNSRPPIDEVNTCVPPYGNDTVRRSRPHPVILLGFIKGRMLIRYLSKCGPLRGTSSYVIAGRLTVLWTGTLAIYLLEGELI
jgi:hypothetical protein